MSKFKIILYISLVLSVIFLIDRGVSLFSNINQENKRLHSELVSKTEEYQQLSKEVAKLKNSYVNEVELKKQITKEFSRQISELKGRVKLLSNATFGIREHARQTGNSDLIYTGEGTKFVVNEIRYKDGPPVGYVLIFDDGRVVSRLYNHQIDVKTAISRDENTGKYSVLSKAEYVLKSPSTKNPSQKSWLNRPFPLPITGGEAVIDPTEKNHLAPKLHLWAPTLYAGLAFSAELSGPYLKPTLGSSFLGYGSTKNDLQWKFLHIGADFVSDFSKIGAHLLPATTRIWPSVLKNSYLGPGIGFSRGGISAQINFNVSL